MNKEQELNILKEAILEDKTLPLRENGKLVFGKGNPEAKIVFIGEAPGEKEAEQGVPFVGRAGQELDKLLRTINLSLEEVYICNILKFRPPKNRDPNIEEIKTHTPYLIKQLKIIDPEIIITLGNYATKFVLANFKAENMKLIQGISKLHGIIKTISLENKQFKVIPIYHPAAMLYNPRLRDSFERDFFVIAKTLGLEIRSDQQSLLRSQ